MLAAILALVLQALLVGATPQVRDLNQFQQAQAHLHHEHHAPMDPAAPGKPSHHASGCCILCGVLGFAVGALLAVILLAPLALSVVVSFALVCGAFGSRRLPCLPVGARAPPSLV